MDRPACVLDAAQASVPVLPYYSIASIGRLLLMTPPPKTHRVDYVVVGSGVAGVRAAIELSDAGSVLVLAKSDLSDSATAFAQGGVAVALSDEDIEKLVAERTQAKKLRNFARADQIRKELLDKGVVIEDSKDGVRWKRK